MPGEERASGLLSGKNAIVYGAAGAIGGAVSRAFSAEGARVHLAGRTRDTLEALASEIRAADGMAEVAVVDALDEAQVDAHAANVAGRFGSIDISFNLISVQDVQGTPMVDMPLADYEQPILTAVRTTFLTARAAARQMMRQRSGVILTFGGDGGRQPIRNYSIGGFQVALRTLDGMRSQLAAELGQYGIRVVTIHTGGIAESLPPDMPGREEIDEMLTSPTMLGRTATFADVGNVAVFLASDRAGAITAASVNITAGAVAD